MRSYSQIIIQWRNRFCTRVIKTCFLRCYSSSIYILGRDIVLIDNLKIYVIFVLYLIAIWCLNSQVWQNYTCRVSDSGSCTTAGQITPDTYSQLETAANVSYALYHYAPLLLNLQDCKFVRDTFSSLTTRYCPRLDLDLRLVCTGLALIAVGVLLCLILWIFVYANRPQREEVFVRSSSSGASRIAPVTASP